jgi:hypothetical protein
MLGRPGAGDDRLAEYYGGFSRTAAFAGYASKALATIVLDANHLLGPLLGPEDPPAAPPTPEGEQLRAFAEDFWARGGPAAAPPRQARRGPRRHHPGRRPP